MSKWIPWRLIVKRLARHHGFLNPLTLYARMQQFAQPSEVSEPIELLRAGAVFHARGLINSRVLQHNLDWVWPYWVERQFDPADVSFLPRAFSKCCPNGWTRTKIWRLGRCRRNLGYSM